MNNELEKMEKYYRIASQYGYEACTEYLVKYYKSIKKYDEMKKYMFMSIDHGGYINIRDHLYDYYDRVNVDDFSFVFINIINMCEDSKYYFFSWMNEKLMNITLPKAYHERFCALDFPGKYQPKISFHRYFN